MPVYMFDLGNSNDSAIGAVVRIHGENRKDALKTFVKSLEASDEFLTDDQSRDNDSPLEYGSVYLNPKFITLHNIVLSETTACDRYEGECSYCLDNQQVNENEA